MAEMEGVEAAHDNGRVEEASHTVYVSNIFEKLKPDDLKKSMRTMFEQFGPIVDVVARRTYRLRGQAWVVFEKAEDAEKAVKLLQGFPFYGKQLRLAISKTKSDATAKAEGTYSEEYVEARRKRVEDEKAELAAQLQSQQEAALAPTPGVSVPPPQAGLPQVHAANKILFLENVPPGTNEGMLSILFTQYPGLTEVRLVPQRPGIAFVEFEAEQQAGTAMHALQGFKMATDMPLRITYAKQ